MTWVTCLFQSIVSSSNPSAIKALSRTKMLPSRLFRNTGLPPPLRSLITPHPSLPASVSVQLRLRLGVLPGSTGSINARRDVGSSRPHSTSTDPNSLANTGASGVSTSSTETRDPSASLATTPTSQSLPESLEPRLSITFTCTVKDCGERSSHQFTKRAYEKGIVLVQCPGCQNR